MKGVDGATTVASTAYLASLAGVKVFVTGGMGGVHRGAEASFDVSADLAELAQTPIVVVCAGVKSILDIDKTLEVSGVWGLRMVLLFSPHWPHDINIGIIVVTFLDCCCCWLLADCWWKRNCELLEYEFRAKVLEETLQPNRLTR